MPDQDDLELDRPMTPDEEAQARLLTASQLERIDKCLLSHTPEKWRKVANVIARTMSDIYDEFPAFPDVFYSSRIKLLAASGVIETAGNLDRMRHSEIRLLKKPVDSE